MPHKQTNKQKVTFPDSLRMDREQGLRESGQFLNQQVSGHGGGAP
jgi:hypothetical protein